MGAVAPVTFFGSGLAPMGALPGGSRLARPVQADSSVMRTRRNRKARGFTLVELMIVVAMVGVLATLAIVGYRKYIHTAQSSEAKATIQMIRGAQEAYKAEMLQYLKVSSSITSFYPNTSPNDTRWAWVNSAHADYTTGWKHLAVNPDGPVRFGYACIAGVAPTDTLQAYLFAQAISLPTLASGTPWYQVQAKNDHDGNSKFAIFGSSSLSGEIMSENEQE
jgi:type IV pilus assembly protein PilA